ncbi:MAG: WYL domain-containing protein [Candidatus Eisenbacteria bacterium]|nr:WYL domain-containing protein [Candidatus Eisenbacteria bacterium]
MAKRRIPLVRLLRLDHAIRSKEDLSAPSLARDLGVSVRTVQRDIDYLRRQGAPIRWNASRRGYEYADLAYVPPLEANLCEGELLSILSGERTLEAYRGTPFEGLLQRLFLKVGRALPEAISVDMKDLVASFATATRPLEAAGPRLPRSVPNAAKRSPPLALRFSRRVAATVAKLSWPPAAKLQNMMDGGLEVTLPATDSEAALQWCLQWGRDVEVLGPRWARKRLVQIAKGITQSYQEPASHEEKRDDSPETNRSPPPSPKED